MNSEGSREPERMVHTFRLPSGLTNEQAKNLFLAEIKPKGFTLEGFKYNSIGGLFYAKGTSCQ